MLPLPAMPIRFLLLCTLVASFAHAVECGEQLAFLIDSAGRIALGKPERRPVPVTGSESHPLEIELQRAGFGVTSEEQHAKAEAMRGQHVLLVAEGFNDTLPFLQSHGVHVKAIDPAYHRTDYPDNERGHKLAAYVAKHGDHLVQGSALDLPFESGSQDEVFCFHLVNWLEWGQELTATREMVRVARKRVFIDGFALFPMHLEMEMKKQGYQVQVYQQAVTPPRLPFYALEIIKP